MVSTIPPPPDTSAREPASKRRRLDKKSRSRSTSPNAKKASTTFQANDEYISLVEDDVPGLGRAEDLKGKARASDSKDTKGRYERERDWDRGKKRQRSRSRSRDRNGDRERDRERERDRRGGDGRYKRDYNYLLDQRPMIEERAPWITGLNFGSCKDAAQL